MKTLLTRVFAALAAALIYSTLVSQTPSLTVGFDDTITPPRGGDLVDEKVCVDAFGLGDPVACNTTNTYGKVRIDFDDEVEASYTDNQGNNIVVGDHDTSFNPGDWGEYYCKAGRCIQMEYVFRCCAGRFWGWNCKIIAWNAVHVPQG